MLVSRHSKQEPSPKPRAHSAQQWVRYTPAPDTGLSEEQVQQRRNEGLLNGETEIKTKSIGRIIRDNVINPFNILNMILAALVLSVGSFKNMLFMNIILINTCIGSFQEIRAKKTIDKLSLISAPKASVVRAGKTQKIPVSDIVLDDILHLSSGNQVCSDCILLEGECEANESLITGESDPVTKKPGDLLLSGSFLSSGSCYAKVEHVGEENYATQISSSAKYVKKPNSEILYWMNIIIKIIGFVIIPVGALLFYKEMFLSDISFQESVLDVVAALIGMIPEGLMLLISVVFAVGVLRLSRHKTLVQELYCIETLARVDTLCLDKTGTITEGTMQLDEILPLHDTPQESIETALAAMMQSLHDSNPTSDALREAFPDAPAWHAVAEVPFSSARKWSGVSFQTEGTYVLGAAEFVLKSAFEAVRPLVESYSDLGHRVLVLAHADAPFSGKELPLGLNPVALILLSDKIRPSAKRTLAYFADQGVTLKVISGDNAHTVSNIAEKAGLEHADRYIDATTLQTDAEIAAAAKEYTVFGRVTPQQKLQLVKALKQDGHTVAMTGDGVNDVLALKEADCSVAMASGSDAARTVSQLVLLDSDFASMPLVVKEGRRSINNLQRSASLFLVKTIFSTLIAVFFIFAPVTYPMEPIQLTLISFFTIGTPSFLLALGPNKERVHGHFIWNVLQNALPAALTMTLNLIMMTAIFQFVGFTGSEFSTLCVLMNGFTGLLMLLNVCRPLNSVRTVLFCAMAAGFTVATIFFQPLFGLVPVTASMLVVLIPMMFFAVFLMSMLSQLLRNFAARVSSGSKRRHTRR